MNEQRDSMQNEQGSELDSDTDLVEDTKVSQSGKKASAAKPSPDKSEGE